MKKYQVTKELQERKWKIGDIVLMDEPSAFKVREYVTVYGGSEPNKHTAITVDSIKLFNNIKI